VEGVEANVEGVEAKAVEAVEAKGAEASHPLPRLVADSSKTSASLL